MLVKATGCGFSVEFGCVPKGTKEDLLVKSSFVPPDGPMALGALTGPLRMAEATGTSSVKMLASPPSPTPVLSLLPSTPVSGQLDYQRNHHQHWYQVNYQAHHHY